MREDPFAPLEAPDAGEMMDGGGILPDESVRVSPENIEATGRSMGMISLDAARGLAGPNTLADLAKYFPMTTTENIIGTIVAGQRYEDLDEDALIEAKEAWRTSSPNERASNFIYDNADQERTVGYRSPMGRQAGYAFLDAPDGSPMAQIRARNAALGIVEGAGGKRYAQVNGQMVELNDEAYQSIVSRNNEGIDSFLQSVEVTPAPPTPAQAQQPDFNQPLSPEVVPGISEKAKQVMMEKAGQIMPKIFAAGTPQFQQMPMGAMETFSRAQQMPINNTEVEPAPVAPVRVYSPEEIPRDEAALIEFLSRIDPDNPAPRGFTNQNFIQQLQVYRVKIVQLEFNQGRNNAAISFSGNTSASLEGNQQAIDGKDIITAGAVEAVRQQNLGISPEKTLAAASAQNRRQKQREAYNRNQQALREWAQKQKTLADEGFKLQDPDTDFLDPDTAAAFGQDQSDYYTYQPGDTQYNEQEIAKLKDIIADMEVQDDFGRPISTRYGITLKDERNRGEYEDLKATLSNLSPDYYDYAPQGAGTSAALEALQPALQAQVPGAADAAGRLEDDLRYDKSAERALAGELVRRDNRAYSAEMRAENDEAAGHIADTIARTGFTVNGPGAMADEAIGRIAEIRKLGTVMEPAVVDGRDAVGDFQDAIVIDGVWRNPQTLEPLAIQGPQRPEVFQGSNTPNTGQVLNVPQGQNASSWLQSNVPEYREGGRVYGDFPQVDINLTATNLANKIRDYGIEGVPEQIRTIEELQQAIDVIGADMAAKGDQAFRFDPETRTNIPSDQFGAEELFTKLRMTGPERAATANMMYQISVARGTEVNQNAKQAYVQRTAAAPSDIVFDAPEAMIDSSGAARIAQIPPGSNVTTGFTDTGKPIRNTIVSQLSALDASPDVTVPYMGAVVDPDTGSMETDAGPGYLTRYVRGPVARSEDPEGMILDQARKRAGRKPVDMGRVRETQANARLVLEREKRDAAARQARIDEIRRRTPANLRQIGRYS